MPLVRIEECEIHYELHGPESGEPLVCIHGWNGSMQGFKSKLLPKLSGRFRVLLFDLPGCGKSEPCKRLSFEYFSQMLNQLLDAAGMKNAVIFGFCMGGVIALDFAIRNPQLVRRLVLSETRIDFPLILKALLLPGLGMPLLDFFLRNRAGEALVRHAILQRDVDYRFQMYHEFRSADRQSALQYMKIMAAYARQDHSCRLLSLTVPVTVIRGGRSSGLISGSVRSLCRNLRCCRVVRVKHAGHFPVEEVPDSVADILQNISQDRNGES
ncbi:MAG: alpha/beta hydrolase [Candidatus Wallbacteria bacterium]|nr:alpha/beta hydrolase [Candidatus Wallbacteria bacterium]